MTDAEVIATHQAYADQHKKAFRAAFDCLANLWPPKNDPEWFMNTAYPVCAAAYIENRENALAREMVMMVFGYLERMAVKLDAGDQTV